MEKEKRLLAGNLPAKVDEPEKLRDARQVGQNIRFQKLDHKNIWSKELSR
jgi:hypothetical protein